MEVTCLSLRMCVRVSNTYGSVSVSMAEGFVCDCLCEREALGEAGGSSELTNGARLGEHGKTSRH